MNKRHADNRRSKKSNGTGEIIGIALIVVAAVLLLCICLPIILGPVSEFIKSVFLGVFGLFSYPMLLALLFLGIALLRDLHLQLTVKSRVCIAIITVCAMLILQLATSFKYIDNTLGFTHYVSEVYAHITAGGVLFGVFAYGLQFAMTQVFTYIVLSTVIIVCVLVMLDIFRNFGKKQKKEPIVEEPQKLTFEKSDRPAKMVRPIENNGLFVGTIVKNQNSFNTEGGSFSEIPPVEQKPRLPQMPSQSFKSSQPSDSNNTVFESYDSVREKYGVVSTAPKEKKEPDRMFDNYNGGERKQSPREILFGNKSAQYRNYIAQNMDSSVINSNIGSYNSVVTPMPVISEPEIKHQPLPPKFVHKESPIPEVVMPAPKDISGDIVGGQITDGEAESQRLAEERSLNGTSGRIESVNSDTATFSFDTKKVQPTTFKPIDRTKENTQQEIAPIIVGDYFQPKTEKIITSANAEPETDYSMYTSDSKPYIEKENSQVSNVLSDKIEQEVLPPIINGENNKPLTELEELIRQDKAIRDNVSAANESSAYFDSKNLYVSSTETENEVSSLKSEPQKESAFNYSDIVEDLSQKSFEASDDSTGYYQHEDKSLPPIVEIPKAPVRPVSLKSQNQMRIEEVLANQPAEKHQPKPKKKHSRYVPPPLDLLVCNSTDPSIFSGNAEEKAKILEDTLESLKLPAKVTAITSGPAVTRYELEIPTGTSVRKIDMYSSDIEYNLASNGRIRIETPIPGKRAVGIEVPNSEIATVALRDLIGCKEFQSASSPVTLAIGKDIAGSNIICNLEKMPHLLIAGATNSGKSACLNSIIASILYKSSPDEVRLILIDPKEVEFRIYKDMPHLLIKDIINETDQAIRAFKWAKIEMDRRYKLLSQYCARNIQEFNSGAWVKDGIEEKLPRIVIIVDELCELMMSVNRKDLEDKIMSMAQKARAAGIHLILATQRPSVDVITGTIKANLPSRIAFAVASVNDSRTILDQGGAESLLGRGDMLYAPTDMPQPKRVQGAYITSAEVESVVNFVKEHNSSDYDSDVEGLIMTPETTSNDGGSDSDDDEEFDPLIKDVLRRVIETGQASTSMIQRRFSVGYARASRIIDQMEMHHFIGPLEGSNKPREVFITAEQFREVFGEDL